MLHSKLLRYSVFLVLFSAMFLTFFRLADAESDKKTIYAVFWRGCEELCQGFQDYIREEKINAEVVIRDADSDKTKLTAFLDEARAMGVDLILTWGTSVTLGITGTVDDVNDPRFNNDIPHVFTGVADPVGSRIVESLDKTGRQNITGTFNRVPESVNISTIRSYMPTFKRLGLIYNTNERNSVLKFEEITALSKQMDFELIAVEMGLDDEGLPSEEDIPVKMKVLKDKNVDFIYLGSSSFLDTHRDKFTGSAVENGIPVLSPYERLVRDSQALLSIAASYYELGKIAGNQAVKILVGEAIPGELPVVRMTNFAYVVNMDVARKLNLFPSVEILQVAETVN
ncbi:ABC transporter substrate-binding protein [Gammaproteobacteria bacterium]|nr:ABC transporter substrate-binding protein [Gammaproteobacteria bacterium]